MAELGARFARAVGLTTFSTWIETFDGVPALAVERYDRSPDAPQGRIHQEDFNHILGATGHQKYQRYGCLVSLERVAKVLSLNGDHDSMERLLQLVVLSAAVGNLDLHTKNLSVLHRPDGSMALAPAYDVVPQAHQQNDGEVALAVAGEYRHTAITLEHVVTEGKVWGLGETRTRALAEETLAAVLELAASETPHEGAHAGLPGDIARFASNLLAGRGAGTPGR